MGFWKGMEYPLAKAWTTEFPSCKLGGFAWRWHNKKEISYEGKISHSHGAFLGNAKSESYHVGGFTET